MNWNDLKYFLAVARAGSLSGAAEALETTASTASRRIDALEAAIKTRLFVRLPGGYHLTDEGARLLPKAEAVEAASLHVAGGANALRGASGEVRLATAENLAVHLIAPALPQFRKQYPNLTLELITEVRRVDMGRFEADVALRLTRPQKGRVRIRRLGHMACAVYGRSSRKGRPFVTWPADNSNLPAARYIASQHLPIAYRANSLVVHQAGAASGVANAILPCFMGDADQRLVRIGEPIAEVGQDIWLVINEDLAGSARVRAVADFLETVVTGSAGLQAKTGLNRND